jgi:K+/H+ antiporter YhaU regulatory subunit KhtT
MSETYKKIDENTIEVTRILNKTTIIEESRDELRSSLNRLELQKLEIQKQIDKVQTKIAVLDT